MNEYTHTVIAGLSIYFAWKIGRNMQKKSLVEEIATETLNRLEKGGMVKYVIRRSYRIYQDRI